VLKTVDAGQAAVQLSCTFRSKPISVFSQMKSSGGRRGRRPTASRSSSPRMRLYLLRGDLRHSLRWKREPCPVRDPARCNEHPLHPASRVVPHGRYEALQLARLIQRSGNLLDEWATEG